MIAYQNGRPHAFGAEAREFVYDENYEIASWFKVSFTLNQLFSEIMVIE
jgi:hypothetical protein